MKVMQNKNVSYPEHRKVLWIHTNEKIGLWPQETIDRQAKPR